MQAFNCFVLEAIFYIHKIKTLEEQHVSLKFCFELGKTFTETLKILQKFKGKNVLFVHNIIIGISVSKQAEHLQKTLQNYIGHHHLMIFIFKKFVSWCTKIDNRPLIKYRSRNLFNFVSHNFHGKTHHAFDCCKICSMVDDRCTKRHMLKAVNMF